MHTGALQRKRAQQTNKLCGRGERGVLFISDTPSSIFRGGEKRVTQI